MPWMKLLAIPLIGLLVLLPSCETLFPGTSETPVVKTTHVQPDGSAVITETPIVDVQKQSHAEATVNLFSE